MGVGGQMTEVRALWDSRAKDGAAAGTRDLIASELERRAILGYVKGGMRVLDVGCGTGETAIAIAEQYDCRVWGIDYSEAMVEQAQRNRRGRVLRGSVNFSRADITTDLTGSKPQYDLIYSQRCLINLPDWEAQRQAIIDIMALLKPGGQYVMIENSQDGLEEVNQWRKAVGLPIIVAPSHNRYMDDLEVHRLGRELEPAACIMDALYPLSTYYLLSRIANAYLAQEAGIEPNYDAPLNRLALSLPSIGQFGQGRMWIFQKSGVGG
jgi:ubiquinone/menaquinone biosynthesis C-methylase UbiE